MLYLKDENDNVLHTFTRREIKQIVNALSDGSQELGQYADARLDYERAAKKNDEIERKLSDGEALDYWDIVDARNFGRADTQLDNAQDNLYAIGHGTDSWVGALAIAQLIGLGFKLDKSDES